MGTNGCEICDRQAMAGSRRCVDHAQTVDPPVKEISTAATALVPPPQATGATPVPQSPMVELQPGTQVGEYVVEGVLGRGGMGVVYRAVHPLIGKTAAIKVLGGAFAGDPDAHGRFVQEARAVNQIKQKSLIDIFGFGQLPDGRQYYVMELLEGLPLSKWIEQKKRLEPGLALPIFHDILRALEAVHENGIVHRDLKPDNIIVVEEVGDRPTIKILDFGVAKLLGEQTPGVSKTQTGVPVGTPLYMSPEQCLGKKIDHRADLYAVGIMLFESLTGRLPFNGETIIRHGSRREALLARPSGPMPYYTLRPLEPLPYHLAFHPMTLAGGVFAGERVDESWLTGAELVRVEPFRLGRITRSLTINDFVVRATSKY